MKKLLTLLVLTIFCCSAISQTRQIDSLRNLVLTTADKEEKKKHLISLLSFHRSMNSDTLLHYTQYLKIISGSDKNASFTSDISLANYYSKRSNYDSALQITLKGSKEAKDYPVYYRYFRYLNSVILLKKNNHKDALTGFFNTLRLAETAKDTAGHIRSLNGIGWTYLEMSQPREALDWLHKALKVTGDKNFDNLHSIIYLNMAPCYGMLGNMDSVIHCVSQARTIAEKNGDLLTLANALALGTNICVYQGDMNKALQLIRQALDIRKVLNDPFYIVSDMAAMADIYSNMHLPEKGIAVANEAIIIARKNNLESKLPFIYMALAANYRVAGDYKNLAAITQQSLELRDSLFQKTKAKELAEMQARYEAEKQLASIKLLQQENELKDIRNRDAMYVAAAIFMLLIGGGTFFYSYSRTIEKRKRAEERALMERRRLHAIIETQEEERRRISAELHDGIGPVLSAVKLNMSQLAYQPEDAQKYRTAMQLIDESYKELRTISHQMMPTVLIGNGLMAAIDELASVFNSSGALKVSTGADDPTRRYDSSLEVNLYRIIQEMMNNIVKYAKATEAQIQLLHERNELSIMIEDNGEGFDKKQLERSRGNGWNNVLSRLSVIGGTIEIDTQPSRKGTVIFITAPIKSQSKI